MENTVKLELAKEWDKTFPKSEKVDRNYTGSGPL